MFRDGEEPEAGWGAPWENRTMVQDTRRRVSAPGHGTCLTPGRRMESPSLGNILPPPRAGKGLTSSTLGQPGLASNRGLPTLGIVIAPDFTAHYPIT